jgi:3-hydroxyacyl-[acyl-carrier-protein] dehydratase
VRWLLIDQLLECDPGRRAVAVKTFPMSDLVFLTHFEANPVVPGVLQIEMVAQAAAKSLKILRPEMVSMLVSVKTAKFLRPVLPGDRCLITVDIKTHDDYAYESGVVEIDGVRVSQMELLVAFKPRVMVEPPERDVVIEAWRRRHGEHNEPFAVGAHAHTIAG